MGYWRRKDIKTSGVDLMPMPQVFEQFYAHAYDWSLKGGGGHF
jgi:hypothetical protein